MANRTTNENECPTCSGTNLENDGHNDHGPELIYLYYKCKDCGTAFCSFYKREYLYSETY